MKKKMKKKKVSKIDLIVPYEDELDYIKDYDGDYGVENASSRFEFEMSPDGYHIVRSIAEVNPYEINQTEELFVRTARKVAQLFGYNPDEPAVMKEINFIVIAWYTITGYPMNTLVELIKSGYFKTPIDVEEFILLIDDFNTCDEIIYPCVPYVENLDTDESEENFEVESFDYQNEEVFQETIPLHLYDKEKEYQLLERLFQIKKEMEKNPEKREELENERKHIIARIYLMREEFLESIGLDYKDYLLARRTNHLMKTFGWVKYPLNEEERYTPVDMLASNLAEVKRIIIALNRAKELGTVYLDEESPSIEDTLRKLDEKRARLEKAIRKLEEKNKTSDEKKVERIKRMIEFIRRTGKKNFAKAYKVSQIAYGKIKQLKDKSTREVLLKFLMDTWKERKERIERVRLKGMKQLDLFRAS